MAKSHARTCPKCGHSFSVLLRCKRCGHKWSPRKEHPKKCPECGSPYWNKARKRKVK